MKAEIFERIRRSAYAHRGSFAIWAHDIKDVSVIPRSISQLTTRVVILGLNCTRDEKREFGNYHTKYRGCKDYYLANGFQYPGCPFTACYMTDFMWTTPG